MAALRRRPGYRQARSRANGRGPCLEWYLVPKAELSARCDDFLRTTKDTKSTKFRGDFFPTLRVLRGEKAFFYLLKSITTRPRTPPFRILSISGLSSPRETSLTTGRRSIAHSPASLFHAIWRARMGISTESTPSQLTPRRMNGNTLTLRSADMA